MVTSTGNAGTGCDCRLIMFVTVATLIVPVSEQPVSITPGCVTSCPTVAPSLRPKTWLFDRITMAGGVALLVNNDPKVPPKQNPDGAVPQIAFALPPDEPSGTGAVNGCMLSESIVNPTDSPMLEFACEIAVTVNMAGSVLCVVATVGTVFGATYMPLADIVPQTEAGVALQLSDQVTPVFDEPVTVAANCTVWKVSIFETSVVMFTVTTGGVLPPPPPQAVNPKAPATANIPARRALLFMGFSLRSRSGNGYLCFSLSVVIGSRVIRRDRTGKLFPLVCANPSREILMRN